MTHELRVVLLTAIINLVAVLSTPPALAVNPDELLPAEQAFALTVTVKDPITVSAEWTIADGYYMYRDRLQFESLTPGVELGEPKLPDGKIKEDEFFGAMEVYRHQLQAELPLTRRANVESLQLKVTSQGCADIGVCYPPQQQTIPVVLNRVSTNVPTNVPTDTAALGPVETAANSGQAQTAALPTSAAQAYVSEQDYVADTLVRQRFWALPLFFGFGLLLAFTPCVFPMIPILSGIIAGQKRLTRRAALQMSVVYVLAMALTYTAAGVGAALVGANIQIWFQKPWVLIGFSALFVVLALSMFGLYELQLPARWQTRLAELSRRQSGGRYAGVGAMGVLSALIVGPCVAAPLIGILSVISLTGDVVLGGAALFVMSLGMGTPLLLIGASAGRILPQAGPWMGLVKAAFGVMLLGVAVWMLGRILPEAVTLGLWAALLIVTAIFMVMSRPIKSGRWVLVGKGLGTLFMAYGIVLAVGAVSGGHNPLQPLRGTAIANSLWASSPPLERRSLPFTTLKTVADLEQQITLADGRPLMLDFYADWCVSCKELENYTFSDPGVQAALAGTQLLKADVTANDEDDQALLRRFGLIGPPAILFFGPDGQEQPGLRIVGFMPADDFRHHLARVDRFNQTIAPVTNRHGTAAEGKESQPEINDDDA